MAYNKKRKQSEPPGDFVSDDQRDETARFLEELRKRLSRKKSQSEPKLGPPRRRAGNPPQERDWKEGA
jgi:hypothetical protein